MWLELEPLPEAALVRLNVRDTGRGIQPKTCRTFLRNSIAWLTMKVTLRALGLNIVKQLVEAHGSQMLVTSEVDVGTNSLHAERHPG